MIFKNVNNYIVNNLYDLCDYVCYLINIDKCTLGNIIRIAHVILVLLVITVFIIRRWTRIYIIVFICLVVISQLLFKGCFITRLERRLCKSKTTFIDPLIMLFGLPLNDHYRYIMTMWGIWILLILAIIVCSVDGIR